MLRRMIGIVGHAFPTAFATLGDLAVITHSFELFLDYGRPQSLFAPAPA